MDTATVIAAEYEIHKTIKVPAPLLLFSPIAKMVALLFAKGASREEILGAISSMENLRGVSVENSTEKDKAYAKQEARKLLDRNRKKLSYIAKHLPKTSVENSVETKKGSIYVEPTLVKTMDVEEKEVTVSRARARKNPGIEIPTVWPTPELTEIGLGFGFSSDETQNELCAMRDWALAKDERRVDWKAFARNWFRTAKKRGTQNGRQNGTRGNVLPAIERHLANFRANKARFEAIDDQGEPRVRDGTSLPTLRLLPQG